MHSCINQAFQLILMCTNVGIKSLLCHQAKLHLHSWRKAFAPLELFQKMHHFSQKSLAITNVLVYTCLFPLSALGQHTKAEEKSQIWHHFKQNSKLGLDKIIGTLNLIFGCTHTSEKITETNRFQEPATSFLHLSTGILDHSSFANCSRSLKFEGCFLATAVLRSFHRCSMGFRSGLIAGRSRMLQCFVSNHFWVLCEVCFGSLSCWRLTCNPEIVDMTILLPKSSDNSWLFFLFSMLGVAHTGTQHKGWVNFYTL